MDLEDEARKTDLLDKMKQKTQMPWLPSKGFEQLSIEAIREVFGKILEMDISPKA
ncbi:hypothetical protein AB6F62_20535 [Providencia huaxiensis]|uniref:hypothetical protein n=1 Tax=Providencia huaxiensis TaxID=2027290 RepID=UPI0034DDB187